jgi:hypothetical protein
VKINASAILFLLFLTAAKPAFAQVDTPTHKGSTRKWIIGGGSALGYGASLAAFDLAWYRNFPRTSFHTYNDGAEWQQMDKIGHAWGAYHTSRLTTDMWLWAGVKHRNAVILGTGSSLLYLLSIEYLDGLSAEWGWSWADVGADAFGAALFAGQEIILKKQPLQIKFSAHRNRYPGMLEARAKDLYGHSLPERLLKDYNGQTYWLSCNLSTLFPSANIPAWLNVSVGYSAEGMFGGYENLARDDMGNIVFDRRDLPRYRQWYLAPDIDLTRIRTGSSFLRTVFSVLNSVKFPAPALEYSRGKLRMKGLAF